MRHHFIYDTGDKLLTRTQQVQWDRVMVWVNRVAWIISGGLL